MTTETESQQSSEEESDLDDVHVEGDKTVDKLRAENRRLTKAIKSKDQQLYDLNQRLGRLEATQESSAEAKEREAGEFAKIEARQQKKIEDLESKLGDVTTELATLQGEKRENKFLDRLMAQTGLKNRNTLRGQLREAAEQGGFETAPEDITDTLVEDAAKAIRDMSPELFKHSSGGSPAGSGHRESTKSDKEKSESEDESRGTQLGKQLTAALRPQSAQR